MKRSITTALALAAAASFALTACGSGGSGGGSSAAAPAPQSTDPVTISLAGWSLATTPEFKTLADGYHAAHPNVTVELKEYDATNYDTQMIADLAAGSAPDIYVQKNLKNFVTYQSGGQLLDVSDVATKVGDKVGGLKSYAVSGKTYAIPYRQDSWVLYYNKDLFDKAGVKYPDGSWTWDDYAKTSAELTTKLKAAGSSALGTYEHTWQSTVQGFALAQTPGADLISGKFDYLKPYYQRVLGMQQAGSQVDYGTVTTNKLTYQSQFGKQKAAMMPMGTWYVATLIAQQAKGDADAFKWAFAPAPQFDSSTTGTSKTPVTFGDPTGLGINPKIAKNKVAAAKDFLAYAAGVDGAKALASIGITPANTSADVVSAYFAVKGAPTDDLSKFAFGTHDTRPENPVSKYTAGLQNVLNDLHSSVLSGSASVDDAIAKAESRAKNEVLNK